MQRQLAYEELQQQQQALYVHVVEQQQQTAYGEAAQQQQTAFGQGAYAAAAYPTAEQQQAVYAAAAAEQQQAVYGAAAAQQQQTAYATAEQQHQWAYAANEQQQQAAYPSTQQQWQQQPQFFVPLHRSYSETSAPQEAFHFRPQPEFQLPKIGEPRYASTPIPIAQAVRAVVQPFDIGPCSPICTALRPDSIVGPKAPSVLRDCFNTPVRAQDPQREIQRPPLALIQLANMYTPDNEHNKENVTPVKVQHRRQRLSRIRCNPYEVENVANGVERILGELFMEGESFFFVKWLNQPACANSWVPRKFITSFDLIRRYRLSYRYLVF